MVIARPEWENDILTIRDLLSYTAQLYGDKPCIKYVDGNDEVVVKSYRDMNEDSRSVCRYIRSLSANRMHIALVGKTNYEYITCMNGIFISGNVAVPLAYDYSTDATAEMLNDSDTEILFYDESFADRVEETLALCPKIKTSINLSQGDFFEKIYKEFNSESANKDLDRVEIDPDECTVIIYTSGTTGNRKGAMLSSRAIISNVYYKELSYEGDNVALNVLPMYHIFCFSCDYLKNLKDGVTVCLNGDIANVGANLLRFEPTVVRMVPMVIEGLMRKIRIIRKKEPDLTPREAAERVFGRRLRNIISSGAYISPHVAMRFEEMGINLRQGYGMTETGPRISVPDGKTCGASVGRIISTCNIRIKDGEIQVSSPSLMMGYYKRPEETEKVFTEDGWLKTGDMGRISEDRELFITGRLKNVIILSNGENVSPEEIEKKYIDEHLIKEIVVYGENNCITAEIFPDMDYAKRKGIENVEETVKAIVDRVNAADNAAREVDKVKVRFEPFPRTATGKIIRQGLEEK